MARALFWLVLLCASSVVAADDAPSLLTAADLADFARPEPDERIFYGDNSLQFGDLRVPDGEGPHPVAIFIHGGCWLSAYDISHSSKLTDALTESGIATWSLEYRRVGDAGGGWPGTFEDIGRGVDHLRTIAAEYNLDLERLVAAGHSAGGQLALWAAARPTFPEGSPFHVAHPLQIRNVLALAPAADLAHLHEVQVCGHVVDKLMGGAPDDVPERYRWSNPTQLDLAGVKQAIIYGVYDDVWMGPGFLYAEAAIARGEDVEQIEAGESGHFEMIDPDSSTWPIVLDAARRMLGLAPAE